MRSDYSDNLFHLLKGASYDKCFSQLLEIVRDGVLRANNYKIKGGYNCVCFTETSLETLKADHRTNNKEIQERYKPFGFILDKRFMFKLGARPVIYQPDDDFEKLPEHLRWKHCRFELGLFPSDKDINLTWEREWRLHNDLGLSPDHVKLFIPDDSYIDELKYQLRHCSTNNTEILYYELSQVFGNEQALLMAEALADENNWDIVTLDSQLIAGSSLRPFKETP